MTQQMRGGPHFSRHIPETLDGPGADAIAATIRNYWIARGYAPKVWVMREDSGLSGGIFVVRSTMVGGQP